MGTFAHTCMLSQLPEAERTSCMTAPLIPQRKYLRCTSYVWGWHMTHSSCLRNCRAVATADSSAGRKLEKKKRRPNNKTWCHSHNDWGSPGDVCLFGWGFRCHHLSGWRAEGGWVTRNTYTSSPVEGCGPTGCAGMEMFFCTGTAIGSHLMSV